MPKTLKHNRITGERAEVMAAEVLRDAGFAVTDLNVFAPNFPLADLVARRGDTRLLIQVRGTTTRVRWFPLSSEKADTFAKFAEVLGHHSIFAFVNVDGAWPRVRFGEAPDVADAVLDWLSYGGYPEGVNMDDARFVDAGKLGTLFAEDD